MRTQHFQAIKRTKQNQIISLENLASKQRILQIVKEQHGLLTHRAIERLLSSTKAALKNNLNIAPACGFLKGFGRISMLVEPAGIEPATSCLQSRRSPS